MEQVEIDV